MTMEPLLETIDLDIEEASELLFKVKVEGIEPAPSKIRLVCETGDVALMFNGHPTSEDGVVQFLLPALKDRIKEGLYQSKVEVLIENRYFSPVSFNIQFKKAVTVVAEAVAVPPRRPVPQVSVTAVPVVMKKLVPVAQPQRPAIVEAPIAKPATIQKPPAQPPQRLAPPPAKFNSGLTLKERYNSRLDERHEEVVEVDESNEDLLRELAQSFVRKKKH